MTHLIAYALGIVSGIVLALSLASRKAVPKVEPGWDWRITAEPVRRITPAQRERIEILKAAMDDEPA